MKKLLIAAAAIMVATPALASTAGDLSVTSSQGSLDVNVNIPKMVRVSGLDDLAFNITPQMLTEPYFSREDQTSTFCVYSNDGADGAYSMQISATQSGASGRPWGLTGPAARFCLTISGRRTIPAISSKRTTLVRQRPMRRTPTATAAARSLTAPTTVKMPRSRWALTTRICSLRRPARTPAPSP